MKTKVRGDSIDIKFGSGRGDQAAARRLINALSGRDPGDCGGGKTIDQHLDEREARQVTKAPAWAYGETAEQRETLKRLEPMLAACGWVFRVGRGCGGHTVHGITCEAKATSLDTRFITIRGGRQVVAHGPEGDKLSPCGNRLPCESREYPRREGRGWREQLLEDVRFALDWLAAAHPLPSPTPTTRLDAGQPSLPSNHLDHPNNAYGSGQQPRLGDVIFEDCQVFKVHGARWSDTQDALLLDCLIFEPGEDGGFRELGITGRDDDGIQPYTASLISRGCDEDAFSRNPDGSRNPDLCFDWDGDACDADWFEHRHDDEDEED